MGTRTTSEVYVHHVSRQGIFASVIGSGFAIALAFAPIAPSAQTTPRGAVTPPGAPGQFSNSPTTTSRQGGQAGLTFDDHGKLRAVGRATSAPSGVYVHGRRMKQAAPKGTVHNGIYTAPRATLPPHP